MKIFSFTIMHCPGTRDKEITEIEELSSPCDHPISVSASMHQHTACQAEEEISVVVDGTGRCHPVNELVSKAVNGGRRQLSNLWKNMHSIRYCCGIFSDFPLQGPHTRVYQVWPGNNVFFFRGRMICGPDPRGLLLTTMSILLSDWTFCAYISSTAQERSTLLAAVSTILSTIVITSLVLASTKDPGIIARSERSPAESVGTSMRIRSKRISVHGVMKRIKYCRICKIHRPPRSRHCIVCDNCVEKFDHHCPWISQCIGLRNYRYYLMFIFSALVFFIYVFAFTLWRIRRELSQTRLGTLELMADAPETFLLATFSSIAIWFLGGLAIFHAYLITLNQTAHEKYKQRYAKTPNPYDKGILGNIKEALFTRLPPSRINFRAVIEPNWDAIARMLATSSTSGLNAEVKTSDEQSQCQTEHSTEKSEE